MTQPATKTTRELSLERRRALSTTGKSALGSAASAPARPSGVIKPKKAAPTAAARPTAAPQSSLSASAPGSAGKIAATPAVVSRQASRNRRLAMSSGGKKQLTSTDRTRTDEQAAAQVSAAPAAAQATTSAEGCGCGCGGKKTECKTKMAAESSASARAPLSSATATQTFAKNSNQMLNKPAARIASLARREAMSQRGKAGISKGGMSEAQTARAGNPGLSARDLSKAVREQRSKNGGAGKKSSGPCGKQRPNKANAGAAQDAPWKVGASETVDGQTVTGTMVGRAVNMTGDEPSTCRGITGTEYLGADIFRNFCQSDTSPTAAVRKVSVTKTSHGNPVSGNNMGRGKNVTGNEQGTCKSVTGDEYTSAEQSQAYCGELASKAPRKVSMAETMKGKTVSGNNVGRSEKVTGDEPGMSKALTGSQYTSAQEVGSAPAKVGMSTTLRGGSVTGTMIGRRDKMTGDEAGSCRNLTGDDYIGQEQYNGFCSTNTDAPTDLKVGVTATGNGLPVTGTMTGRSGSVTGNEPGTCKAVTGTPYAGAGQSGNFCQAEDVAMVSARNRQLRSTPAMPMTGLQPGVGGVMTGANKGACEPVSGTPYVGADHFADACPATAATSASSDYPQAVGGNAVGQDFSVAQPSGGAAGAMGSTGVTGNQYERGEITGPFGMADGKVTGTEDARFGHDSVNAPVMRPAVAHQTEGRDMQRISGEGQEAGLNITGDNWDRGNHVTGTEGMSSTKRNPTIRASNAMASMQEMAAIATKRNEEVAIPNSKVTGGSGNTDKGSLITYSGGARG